MDQKILFEFEAKCIQEEAPACQSNCPLHMDVRSFSKLMANGQTVKARQLLDKVIPLSCLSVFLCEGICEKSCRVRELSGSEEKGVNINLLERACILNSSASKMMPFPSSRKKIALIGAGLSSLILAYELNKKGHQCTIFHTQPIAADILSDSPLGAKNRLAHSLTHDDLNKAIENALSILKTLKVSINQISEISLEFLQSCLKNEENNFQAIFLSYDDSTVQNSEIFQEYKEKFIPNSISLVTQEPKILCGGFFSDGHAPFIQCIADGKRAAGSIERIMQGVDPAISREKENTYPTKLFTNLEGMVSSQSIIPTDLSKPSLTEALEEAKRCIDCSCLECLKQCSFLTHYKAYPKKYLREIYNNVIIIKGTRIANAMINTCTQCGLCEKICPNGLNMGEFIDLARRELVDFKRMPPSAHEFALDDMTSVFADNVQFLRSPIKQDFQKTSIKNEFNENASHDIHNQNFMFFSGCQLPAVLPNEVETVYKHLTSYLNIGFHFSCCGIPAKWAGNEPLLQKIIDNFIHNWKQAGQPIYVFACSSCAEFFKIYCPQVTQMSLWEVLVQIPLPEKQSSFTLNQENHNIIIHDPCSVREVPQTYNAVRSILNAIKQDYKELSFSKELTRCCGNGGLSAEVSPSVADSFVLNRIHDIQIDAKSESENKNSHDDILLVYCAICRERYQKKGQNALHLLELIFADNLENLVKKSQISFLKIYERNDNRIEFRKNILKNVFNENVNQEETNMKNLFENITLNISPELEKILDERRILRSDILKVIVATFTNEEFRKLSHNNLTKDTEILCHDISVFHNTANNHYLAAYRPRLVTFWVEYMKNNDNTYTIFDAYSHRMIVPGVQTKNQPPLYETCCK